ncbi:MAG: glycerol-3-phosphate acyltransferase [Spirochaetota bacterium]
MSDILIPTAVFIACYLVGAVPFSLLIGFAAGVDIRTKGSGNIGATNVIRSAGLVPGIFAFVLDIGKGLGMVIAAYFVLGHFIPGYPKWYLVAAALAAIIGHIFPVYLKFKGGKGVATSAGAVFVLAPVSVITSAIAFGIAFFASGKTVAIGSTAAAITFPIILTIFQFCIPSFNTWFFGIDYPYLLALSLIVCAFIVIRHIPNYKRLLAGSEMSFSKKKAAKKSSKGKRSGGRRNK